MITILERLWAAGHDAWVVGGGLRDLLLGGAAADWDVATSARPEETQRLFARSVYENRFGTVGVRLGDATYEVTTFRREHVYADHRRPERVEFGTDIDEDLARRDFTINAIAWGGKERERARLHDPFAGLADLDARVIRAVGRPDDRFAEDALRMLRAVRLAATLGFALEPRTMAAIGRQATLAEHLSAERLGAELRRILAAPRPSVALSLMEETGLLAVVLPELAAQRGIAQNKVRGADLWDHTLATVDAAPADPVARLAALFHDIAKPATLRDGHFPDHDREGAVLVPQVLRRLAVPRRETERVAALVGAHMFDYSPAWSDAAVRRFIRRVGVDAVDGLLALREADNAGSGLPREAGGLDELRSRIDVQLKAHAALGLGDLAVDGDDLRRDLGIAPGPEVGRLLDALLERVLAEPALNRPEHLLAEARRLHEEGR